MIIKNKENYCRADLITKDYITEICQMIKVIPLAIPIDSKFEFICSPQEKIEVKEVLELRENNFIPTIGYIEIGVVEDKQYYLDKRGK